MKKSCKLFCLVLVMILMLAMFAGCAGGGGNTPPPNHEVSGTAGNDNTETTEPTVGGDTNNPVDPTVGKNESGSEVVGGEQGENPADPDVTDPGTEVPGGDTPDIPDAPDDPVVPTEPGHEHAYTETVVGATCTEAGYTQYTCTCGDSYRDNEVPVKGHAWNNWIVVKEATETAEGSEKRTCGNCTEAETRVLPVVIPGHTHSYVSKVTKKATCTTEGVKTFTCNCGHSYTEAISKVAHTYTKKVVKATCTAKGYTVNTCSCGKSFKDAYTAKAPHTYKDTVVKATCKAEGYTLHKCTACGESYKDKYTEKADHQYVMFDQYYYYSYHRKGDAYECTVCGDTYTHTYDMTEAEIQAFYRDVEAAIVKYINQFRVEQGDTEMEYLPGMSQVAQYRAVQLKDDFRHSATLLREAHAYYQYGKYIDATKYGDDASLSYWSSNSMEAIAETGIEDDADSTGRRIAECFRKSSGHWSYLGSSDYKYIGVGFVCTMNGCYTCILQPDANYG